MTPSLRLSATEKAAVLTTLLYSVSKNLVCMPAKVMPRKVPSGALT